jgi:P-type Mg2+ transporter
VTEVLQSLQAEPQGLTQEQASRRLARYGLNLLKPPRRTDVLTLLLAQFASPIILILFFAAGLSFFLQDSTDTIIILAIVLASGLLGFWQERGAATAVEKLLAIVRTRTTLRRGGKVQEVAVEEVVPGDIVLVSAGGSIPGDCLLLESRDLFVDEASLTGETYPVEKEPGTLPVEAALSERTNTLFTGTHVVSGTATAVVVRTGTATEFGKISERLRLHAPETEFERGLHQFGYLLAEVTSVLVLAIFAVNVFLAKPVLDSLLFSLALAVGLTPQLLPAIVSINLARGARRMADAKVIVKRLSAIENLGSMDVLCSDKTGTLTEGVVHLTAALDVEGNENDKVLQYAYLNAVYETGFLNPIDQAIRTHRQFDLSGFEKLDEVPYDFVRKRLSILVAKDGRCLLITKGALSNVVAICSSAETAQGKIVDLAEVKSQIEKRYEALSAQGSRTLAVAYRELADRAPISKDDEVGLTFLGFLVLADPPKADIVRTIDELRDLGVTLKLITGDNRLVAANVGQQVGLVSPQILPGPELNLLGDEALRQRVSSVDIFAEVEPNQKERIILALKKAGHVVGYIGDGINDASALHAADVGISVESAVDVAKEAAEFVLLEKDLSVLARGVREGRITFANTLKYVFMATSANFGNMFSMAGASLFLPFLPLLPKQILLTNLLTDFPEMTIATDRVDDEMVKYPRRWDVKFIRNFMLTFGVLSSVFDCLTFVALLTAQVSTEEFRTGWFLESVISASLIVLVIRTRRPAWHSLPSRQLFASTLVIIGLTLMMPYTPIAAILGFQPLPFALLGLLGLIVVLYVATAEVAKRIFYQRASVGIASVAYVQKI